jgi:predicted nucleic acid-binding protein
MRAGMTDTYFADTYALVELLNGNPRFAAFRSARLFTTRLNIAELYYALLREQGQAAAEESFLLSKDAVAITDSSIRNGMRFKFAFRKEKLSYADCIGYALSLEHGIPFLTGDEKFADKPNVAFVQ